MKTRFLIQYSGWNENSTRTDKIWTIVNISIDADNIEGDITMEMVLQKIENDRKLSPFRRNKSIEIHHMQAF